MEKGERVTIERDGQPIAEIVQPTKRRTPKFGTLRGKFNLSPEQFHELTRPMTDEEIDAFFEGRY